MVLFLLESGVNVHAVGKNALTPLHSASRCGHLVVVKLLLKHGADIDLRDGSNHTPADLALGYNNTEVAGFLAEYKEDENVRNKIRSTTFDTSPNGSDEDGKDSQISGELTTLHTATIQGKSEIVLSFIERGTDVNSRSEYQWTPLILATIEGNLEIASLLIEHGAEVDLRNDDGATSLHFASRDGHLNIVRLLIDRGADVNARRSDGWTSVHFSAANGHLEIVELLLARGANPHYRSDVGQTPFQIAARWGYRNIKQLLMEHGAT
jgi:serine/threonine-protein phosphatase 6 regulatory ankyrin repeat subunit B